MSRIISGLRQGTRKLLKPVLRPVYNRIYQHLIRMLTQADPKMQHETYPLRRLISHPARQHPLLFDPARCLHPFTGEEFTSAVRESARLRLGIPLDQYVVVSLGMMTHNKGPLACLSAIEQVHVWNVHAHFYWLGAVHSEVSSTIQEEVSRLGLTESVHLWNQPIDDNTYRDFLIAADCAIQIQTHLPGTFSGALLDCLSAGLPTICNRELAKTMNTPGFVRTVLDELSPLLIAEQLLECCNLQKTRGSDNCFRSQNIAEHNGANYSPQILKLLLAS